MGFSEGEQSPFVHFLSCLSSHQKELILKVPMDSLTNGHMWRLMEGGVNRWEHTYIWVTSILTPPTVSVGSHFSAFFQNLNKC